MFTDKILPWIPQQVKNEGICIRDFTGVSIEDENGILCSFKKATVFQFGFLESIFQVKGRRLLPQKYESHNDE